MSGLGVAVIGAGVAGLACAVTLERLGIETVVYEQGDRPGQAFAHVGAVMPVVHRPFNCLLYELQSSFGFELKPLALIQRIRMYGPTVSREITGSDLGFTLEVSRAPESVTGQLARLYRGPLVLNTRADYFTLRDRFDYVVVAAGNREIPAMLGVWQDWLRAWVVGAQVLGDFDPGTINMWLDHDCAGNGYGYMIPFNERLASLSLVVIGVRRAAAFTRWKDFLKTRRLGYPMVYQWDIEHIAGYVYPCQVNNTLFVGISGGFMDALLGYSIFSSLFTGVLAARAIAGGEPFPRAVAPLQRTMLDSFSLRRALDRMENDDLDRLVAALALPGVRDVVCHSRLNVLGAAAAGLEWYRRGKARLRPGPAFEFETPGKARRHRAWRGRGH